jgi:hypothetical protein
MSKLRIALVAEGPTDYEVIQAALSALLPVSFVLTQLQPEPTLPDLGTGWGGVLKWCEATGSRHTGALDLDPTLTGFDLLIIHLDADVAHKQYSDYGPDLQAKALARNWPAMPCNLPCPPAADTCSRLEHLLSNWLNPAIPAQRTIWCVPAQSTGAWLAAAVLPQDHALLVDLECNLQAEDRLGSTAVIKAHRIKKQTLAYRTRAPAVKDNWGVVKQKCPQATQFEQVALAAFASLPPAAPAPP